MLVVTVLLAYRANFCFSRLGQGLWCVESCDQRFGNQGYPFEILNLD